MALKPTLPTECPHCNGTGKFQAETHTRLIWLRKHLNLKQDDVAPIIGVTRAQLANIEGGRSQLTTDAIIKLSRHYNVSSDWILGLET